jgi:adenylosuccinate lyase
MRKCGMENPYEKLKDLTRGNKIEKESLRKFISSLNIPEAEKDLMLKLEPKDYIGNADIMAKNIRKYL